MNMNQLTQKSLAAIQGAQSLAQQYGQQQIEQQHLLLALVADQEGFIPQLLTAMGMTGPISAMTVVTWLRHPSQEENQVEAARLSPRLRRIMVVSAAGTTWAFYYILKYFHTAQLPLSTLSVTTSFLASYLMLFRSSMYAVAYAANDLVLIGLWVLAARNDPANWSMAICFAMFFCNDLYGFVSWRRRQRQQEMLKAQQEN